MFLGRLTYVLLQMFYLFIHFATRSPIYHNFFYEVAVSILFVIINRRFSCKLDQFIKKLLKWC